MRESVKVLMDQLFAGAPDTEEIRSLREEISNNCEEHFQDLTSQGLSEEEAAAEIASSLRGMEDVVAELSRRIPEDPDPEAPAADIQADAEPLADPSLSPEAESSPEGGEVRGELNLPAAGLQSLKIQAVSEDLELGVSGDDMIHISWNPDSNARVVPGREGDALSLSVIRDLMPREPEDGAKQFFSVDTEEGSFSLNFRELARKVKSVFQVGLQTLEDVTIRILVPAGVIPSLDISGRAGDISVRGCGFLSVRIRSVSGDISFRDTVVLSSLDCGATSGDISVDVFTESLTLSTLSGDIEVQGGAVSAEIRNTSGDVNLEGGLARGSVTTISGDIDLTLRSRLNVESLRLRSTSGDVDLEMDGEGPIRFTLSSVSGDTDCARESAEGGGEIQISTVSGDITVR